MLIAILGLRMCRPSCWFVEFLVLDPYLLVVFPYPIVLVVLVRRSWWLRLRAGPVLVILLAMLLLSH